MYVCVCVYYEFGDVLGPQGESGCGAGFTGAGQDDTLAVFLGELWGGGVLLEGSILFDWFEGWGCWVVQMCVGVFWVIAIVMCSGERSRCLASWNLSRQTRVAGFSPV